jgi:hypothetical protein
MQERKKIGKLLQETQDAHMKEQIEVGELIEEVGNKEVMKEIWRQIDERRVLPEWKEKFYLIVYFKKNYKLQRVMEVYVQSRHTRPNPEQGLTLFSFDPSTEKLSLEWTLPDVRAFNTFLHNRYSFDPFLIECIEKFKAGKLV